MYDKLNYSVGGCGDSSGGKFNSILIFYYLFVINVSYLLAIFHLFKIAECLVFGFY